MKNENNDKCKTLGNTVVKLCNKVTKVEKYLLQNNIKHIEEQLKEQKGNVLKATKKDAMKKNININKPPACSSIPSSFIQPSTSSTMPPNDALGPSSSSSSRSKPIQSKKTSYLCQPNVLYVGDSVGHTANLLIIEKSQNCRIRSARAYSSVKDSSARWPEKNFTNVVKSNLINQGKDNYDMLVMSSPTVDISNLDTSKLGPKDST